MAANRLVSLIISHTHNERNNGKKDWIMRINTLDDLQAVKAEGVKLTYPEKIKIMVGMATCGISAGGDKVYPALAKKIAELGLDVALEMTGCIGFCQREPLVDVVYPNRVRLTYQAMNVEKAEALVEAIKADQIYPENLLCRIDQEELLIDGKLKVYANPHPVKLSVEVPRYEEVPFFKKQVKIALRNCGYINPERIEESIGRGGYQALYKVLKEMTPKEVIALVKDSGLRGRGGGGFPTGLKWEFCHNNASDMKYVICNADEGDPGAFMDRGILEGDPHAVVEGMAIGGICRGRQRRLCLLPGRISPGPETAGEGD